MPKLSDILNDQESQEVLGAIQAGSLSNNLSPATADKVFGFLQENPDQVEILKQKMSEVQTQPQAQAEPGVQPQVQPSVPLATQGERNQAFALETGDIAGAPLFNESILSVPGRLEDFLQQTKLKAYDVLYGSAGDIGGAIGGGIAGFFLAGPIGSMLGSIVGSAGGKQVDIARGTRPDESVLASGLKSAGEEAVGRIGGRIALPIARKMFKPFTKGKFLDEFENAVLKETELDPAISDPLSVLEAQDRLLGRRRLLSYEETAGRLGEPQIRDLMSAIKLQDQISGIQSVTSKNRASIISDMTSKVKGDNFSLPKNIEAFSQGTIKSIEKELGVKGATGELSSGLNKEISLQRNTLNQLREQVSVSLPAGTRVQAERILQDASQELPIQSQKITKAFDKLMLTPDGQATKNYISLADLETFEKTFTGPGGIIGEFKEDKAAQKEIAGFFGTKIKPMIEMLKTQAYDTGEKGRAVVVLEDLMKQNVLRAKGLNNIKQKLMDSPDLRKLNFKDAQEATEFMQSVSVMIPDLATVVESAYRSKVLNKIYNVKSKEFNVTGISNILSSEGPETLEIVGGEGFSGMLRDIRIIQSALDETRNLSKKPTPLGRSEDLIAGTAGALQGSIISRINLASTLIHKDLRRTFGINTSDEKMLNALTGEAGQDFLVKYINTPINTEKSYVKYLQFIRELTKLGIDASPIDQSRYNSLKENDDEEDLSGIIAP